MTESLNVYNASRGSEGWQFNPKSYLINCFFYRCVTFIYKKNKAARSDLLYLPVCVIYIYFYLFIDISLQIYLNFHMSYTNTIGEQICDGKTLVIHYVKGKMPLDLLASFPIDLFALAAPADKQLFVLSYLRLLHLLRLVRMQQFFSELAQRLNVE